MLRTRVMPCLLLKGGKLVKTRKFRKPDYVGDPVNAVKIYNDKEVDELIFLDITATKEKRDLLYDKIREIASECFMPFSYGGGIDSVEKIRKMFSLGVEKVAVNSFAVRNPAFITEAMKVFGSQSIIVSIDVKKRWTGKYEVYIEGGTKRTGLDPVEWAREAVKRGAGELLLNSIDRDGMMEGYDLELIKSVANSVDIPLIACGGAGEVKHFTEAVSAGASAVAAGSMVVYSGKNRSVLINFPSRDELNSALE